MKPIILISNDDGIYAKGLHELVRIASQFGRVFVVAPQYPNSGKSHAITIAEPIRVQETSIIPNAYKAYACTGTPADSIKLAVNKILPQKPDFVFSGINHGSNASISALYSGTIGAATEGAFMQIPSIGFSLLDTYKNADFTQAEDFIKFIIKQTMNNPMPKNTLLNVNIPKIKKENIKGIQVCRQTIGFWQEELVERKDPHNKTYYWLTGSFNNIDTYDTSSDEELLQKNYITIVPIKTDITNHEAISKLNFLNH